MTKNTNDAYPIDRLSPSRRHLRRSRNRRLEWQRDLEEDDKAYDWNEDLPEDASADDDDEVSDESASEEDDDEVSEESASEEDDDEVSDESDSEEDDDEVSDESDSEEDDDDEASQEDSDDKISDQATLEENDKSPDENLPSKDGIQTKAAKLPEIDSNEDASSSMDQLDVDGVIAEPSEMDIEIQATPEEEKVIDEEIEEWDEQHGKGTPTVLDTITVEDEGEMEIPQTPEEEELVNEKVEEWKEDHKVTHSIEASPTAINDKPQESHIQRPKDTKSALPSPTSPPNSSKHHPKEVVARERSPTPPPVASRTVPPTAGMQSCSEFSLHTIEHFSCRTGIPSIVGYSFFTLLPLFMIACCWKYCCRGGRKQDSSRGEYRAIANTYGDASFDNAFADTFSDDEDDDMEDFTWTHQSNGKRVLEMSDLGHKQGDDDLDLDEMNG